MRLYDEKKGVVSVRQVLYRLLMKNGVVCSKEEFGIKREDKVLTSVFDLLPDRVNPEGPRWKERSDSSHLSEGPPSSTGDANRDCVLMCLCCF